MVTMSNGSVRLRTPRLWAIGCVLVLGLTAGVVVAYARPDLVFHGVVFHDAYFVVAHFRYLLHLPVVFAFFAGWYYLFPSITGYEYSDTLGRIHFWLLFIGVNTALAPEVLLASGLAGRVVNAPDGLRHLNLVSWIGSYISAAGILAFLVTMALAFLRRRPANRR
jgi:cytochrome c oxidase subunit 1